MTVQKLDFAEPFFQVDYVEDEPSYDIGAKSLVFNLAERSQTVMYVKGMPIMPLKGTVVQDVQVTNIGRALIVKDYDRVPLDDEEFVKGITSTWRTIYECSGLERHRGLPYYKSPKVRVGGDTELNFCFVSQPMVPSGPHKDHDRDFDEVHAQIRGFGCMQKFEENDPSTYYQESNLAPGVVHEKFYDENGDYPWHQYQSITPCIYMPIEIDR